MSQRHPQIDYVNQDRRLANPLYVPPVLPLFDGPTYKAEHDAERLSRLLDKVFDCMRDRRFRTLQEIQAITGGSEAGVSARLRDLRKSRWGGHTVERRRRGEAARGIYEYQLIENRAKEDQ